MLYDACLGATALVYAWIAGDLLFARQRRRFRGLGIAGLAVSVWCIGELLVRGATSPEELVQARRVLFLGVCALGPAWFLGASAAAQRRWMLRWPTLAALLAVPGVVAYASLYTGSTVFADATTTVLTRGPLFWLHAGVSWLLVFAGFAVASRHLARLGSGWPLQVALVAAAAIPFVANAVYVTTGFPTLDPTPVALGAVALALRFILLDTAMAPDVRTLARSELLDQLPQGFLVADRFGEIVEANLAAHEIMARPDLVGLRASDVIAEAMRHPLRVIEVETSVLKRGGVHFGTIALLEDRTEIRAAERRLEIATRFEALGFLISGVTHQISNPLSYVRGNLSLLDRLVAGVREHPEFVEQLPPALRRIARDGDAVVRDAIVGADRITALVRRLGILARTDVRRPAEEVDLAMLAQQAVELAGLGQAPDQIRVSRPDAVLWVRAREQDLLQVLLHLLINAIQASGKDEPIDVEVDTDEADVRVRVLDRGPGIPPELLPLVFDPFFTTKDGEANLGLGLSLSYDLARQNGGVLEASAREDGGACFELRIPMAEPPPDA
ncbi:MAG: histidine kinase N-terminal 7TM domain-containing protein [Myxococcota bacterium]|nr:histidine kinase N-terminal 7TM domain-containing protein [Myxococcota bacterium]